MLLKIIGSFMVVSSSTLLGFWYSQKYTARPQCLRLIQTQLQFLETEICYMSNTLPEAFNKIKLVFDKQTSLIFKDTAYYLTNRQFINVSDAWETAVRKNIYDLAINNEDAQLLISFGKSLGNSDCENQKKNIRNILSQLQLQEQKAETEKIKNEKLCKNMGMISGILITIVLL